MTSLLVVPAKRVTLEEMLTHLEKHGFRLKLEKCEFLLTCIKYLGHVISKDGIQPVPSKVEAIVNAPISVNIQQLRSFLGLINYYGKFIPNLSTLLHPLNALLQANKKWEWTSDCFKAIKDQIISASVLTHYDPTKPITLAADALAYGAGAVISHVLPDNSECPIAFASCTLTTSERNYAQLEQVDVLPSKNQAFCCKLNLLIQCIVMTSCEQKLITKEHITTHTNLFLWFNSLNTQVLL